MTRARPGPTSSQPLDNWRFGRPLLSLLVVLAAGGACGGSAAPGSKAADSEPMPKDAESTLHLVDKAENELSAALGDGGPADDSVVEAEKPKEELDKSRASELGEGKARDSCGPACRALHSMRRAVEHLCGLTGEADTRCETARGRVARAEDRVRTSCNAC